METALVVAIIRRTKLKAAEERLHAIGVRGITVKTAKGFSGHAISHDILGHI